MDTADINGVTYIKAKRAAEEVGYTADYVGQLCRSGKIEAVMLGKTWYVREGAVADHKREARRTNVTATRRDLERQMEAIVGAPKEPESESVSSTSNTANISYEPEDVEVFPHLIHHKERTHAGTEEEKPPSFSTADSHEEVLESADEGRISDVGSETQESNSVPVHRVATPAAKAVRRPHAGGVVRRSAAQHPRRDHQNLISGDTGKQQKNTRQTESSNTVQKQHRPARTPLLLPAAAALALLFALSHIAIEGSWKFLAMGDGEFSISKSYSVATPAHMAELGKDLTALVVPH